MGDVHVHTAPHNYEANGYDVWYWGDMTFSLVYLGIAAAEAAVAYGIHKRKTDLPWSQCGGGAEWWARKFGLLVSLIPLTLIRSWNLLVWGLFNGDAESQGMDPEYVNSLKIQGDWLNAVTYWYLLMIKAIFLLTWVEINRFGGHIKWKSIYMYFGVLMLVLILGLGIPQYLVVEYGRICQMQRQNDYCRKYHDITSSLAISQALLGLIFGVVFGVAAWKYNPSEEGGYQPLPSQGTRLVGAESRDSYGSTDGSDRENAPLGGDSRYLYNDARRYTGAAYCVSFSLLAHTALNVYFAWYASGALGLIGNQSLMFLTILKMIAVELAPLGWITITVYGDFMEAEKAVEETAMESMVRGVGSQGAKGQGAVASAASAAYEDLDPPPATVYQIE